MYTFRKEEKLCSKKQIDDLFASGNSFFVSSYRVLWKKVDIEMKYPAQVLITVPKHNFKKAVKRNLLKRKIREAYRLNKHILYNELDKAQKKIALIIIYSKKEEYDYSKMEEGIKLVIKQIMGKILID